MSYANNVSYSAVTVGELVYTLTLETNRQPIPEGVPSRLVISDDDGNFAEIRGERTGNTLNVLAIFDSSNAKEMPTFTAGLKVKSTPTALEMAKIHGKQAIAIVGDSNAVGYSRSGATGGASILNNDGIDGYYDYLDSNVLEFVSNLTPNYRIAKEPLRHIVQNFLDTTNNVSILPALGKEMKFHGCPNPVVIPCGRSGASFIDATSNSYRAPNGEVINAAVNHVSAFINQNKGLHTLELVVFSGCTNDDIRGYLGEEYHGYVVDMVDYFRTQVFANTGVDVSHVPWVFIGCTQEFIDGESSFTYAGIEPDVAAIPSYVRFSSYLALPWSVSNGDAIHNDAPTNRRIAREIPALYYQALQNRVVQTVGGTGTVVTMSNTPTVTQTALQASVTAPETAEVVLPDPSASTPLTDALGFDIQLRGDSGKTIVNTNEVSGWQNLINDEVFAVPSGATNPTNANDGIVCNGSNSGVLIPFAAGAYQNSAGGTTVIEFTPTTDANGYLIHTQWNFIGAARGASNADFASDVYSFQNVYADVAEHFILNQKNTIVISTDSSEFRVDVNGVTRHTDTTSLTSTVTSTPVGIGGVYITGSDSISTGFEGTIHNVLIKHGAGLAKSDCDDAISEF